MFWKLLALKIWFYVQKKNVKRNNSQKKKKKRIIELNFQMLWVEKLVWTEPWKLSQIAGKPGSDLTRNKELHYQKQNGKHVMLLSALTPSRETGREWQTFSDRPAPFVHPL